MYLAWAVEYAVQAGWSLIVSPVRFLPLAGLGATESGVNYRVISVIAITSAFVFIVPELAGAVFGLRGACFVGCVCTASQPTILIYAKAGHKCHLGCHGSQLFLAEMAGKPFVPDAILRGC